MLLAHPGIHQHRCDLVHPASLTDADIGEWMDLCRRHPDYNSPLLGPHFARFVAQRRSDVRCLLLRRHGRLMAAMAMHLRPLGVARPIGAPFNDYSGPVLHPDCDLPISDMLTLAGVGAYRANNVVDPYGKLTGAGAGVRSVSESYAMCIDGRSTSDRMEALRAEHAKRFKNFRRLGRKIETDHGELKLGWGSPDPDELGQLLAWKSDQFRREKLVDLTTATYSSHILQETGQATGDNLAGFMVKLTLNGKLLVGHFGVRAGDVFHPWISAYDRAYSAYTPGMILLLRAAPAMADMGLSTYDLAAGHRHYKKYFVNRTRRVLDLFAVSDSAAGKARQAAAGLWALAGGARPTSLVARIGRHVDHVAVSEARLGSRLARIAAASLRNAAGETAEV